MSDSAKFYPIRLSAKVQSTTDAVAALEQVLQAQRVTPQTVECFNRLQAEVIALREAVGLNDRNSLANIPPVVNPLEQTAIATLWDEVPLQVLADVHMRNAEALARYGQSDAQVYVECHKYLHLHPTKEGPDFHKMVKRATMLAHKLAHN
ncbi:hypothetical protein FB45DRAFT_150955 [Roridomyces roridus]|uniref:Uncharacterized protein n=1 Tax=Roridomyces roridus TaxID=1738132 RepID=A0AAD7BGP4_9AGAR|nr:hypothetical protein FB45DRAFT_150955 [Roridomyces roridus]